MDILNQGLGPASQDLSPIRASKKPAKPESKAQHELMKACKDFESVMLTQVFKQMRASVDSNDPLNQGAANKTYREMLDDEWGKSMAANGGIGLADAIYRQLSYGVE